jgi:hypothetical protein
MISATGTRRGPQRWTEADIFGVKGALRRIDDGTTPKSFGLKPLIAKALLSFVGVAVLAATAHAEDCLAAPNSPAREGTRWYYRLERVTQHKCWYMRALDQPAQRVATPTKTALSPPAFAIPLPRPRPSVAASLLPLSPAKTDTPFSRARYAIPIPRPRPSDAGSSLSVSRGDSSPHSSYAEATFKPGTTPPVSGPTGETTSSIPQESASQPAGTSLAAPAARAAPVIGSATDETTSAIAEMHREAPSPEIDAEGAPALEAGTQVGATTGETSSPTSDITASQQAVPSLEANAEATAPARDVGTPVGAITDEISAPTSGTAVQQHAAMSSEPNVQKATLEPPAPRIIAPMDGAASSIPNDSAAKPSNSSDFRPNEAEPVPDVSVAQPQAPLAASTVNAQPTPLDAPYWTARRAELTDNAQILARPFPLICAFVLALVRLLIRACVARGLGRVFIN